MLESTNPLKTNSALQSATIQDNTLTTENDLDTLNLTGSSQSSNDEILTSSVDSQNNSNPSPYISSPSVIADFNGDGNQDTFWRNSETGENAIWLMDGSNPTGSMVNTLGTEWDYSIADFNGDGKTDLIWRNQNTGENLVWLMDGTQIVSEASLNTLGTEWDYSIGEFNGDGNTDLIWRNNNTGENAAWLMDGTDANGYTITEIETSWSPMFGDFNGDARTDILWSNQQSGENTVWITSGVLFTDILFSESTLDQLGSQWEASIGDFNSDGRTDVFWRNNQTGENTAWLMDGGDISTKAFLPYNDLSWEPIIGDYTGDGKTDIFWRNNQTGGNAIWIMNGTIAEGEYLPNFEPGWYAF